MITSDASENTFVSDEKYERPVRRNKWFLQIIEAHTAQHH